MDGAGFSQAATQLDQTVFGEDQTATTGRTGKTANRKVLFLDAGAA